MQSTDRTELTRPTGNWAAGSEPADVVDRLLWRDAMHMLGRHCAPDRDSRCVWCGWQWPCPPRRLAERAEEASRRPWRESWTARHDLNGLRALPSWRGGPEGRTPEPAPVGPARRAARHHRPNRGLFD